MVFAARIKMTGLHLDEFKRGVVFFGNWFNRLEELELKRGVGSCVSKVVNIEEGFRHGLKFIAPVSIGLYTFYCL